tara:strand:- start:10380 stop:11336 length:957 start_codon:yes stop_codon:yes gene_type:complete
VRQSRLPPAIFLMGPTASGKTALALALANRYPCDIISVDSALVYRDMDIGTAKPDAAMLAQAPHRLINLCDPAEPYSAATFREDALREMAEISARGRIPLLVGGTMMYFKFLRDGAADLPQADESVRSQLLAEAETQGWPWMHERLAEVDPAAAARLQPMDQQRIQRALEVYRVSGKTLTQYWAEQQTEPLPYQLVNLAVCPTDRALLHQRIAWRFEQMLQQGFVDEVRRLYQRGDLHTGLPSIRAVGYRQVWEYLDGLYDYDSMRERGIIATRQLAKRQITWLRSWPDLHWLETDSPDLLTSALKILEANAIFSELP